MEEILTELKKLNEKMDKLILVLERSARTIPGMQASGVMPGMPAMASQVGAGNFNIPTSASANFNAEDMKAQIEDRIRKAREESEKKRLAIESQAGPKA